MKINQVLLLLLFVLLSNITRAQCPQFAFLTASEKCLRFQWTTPPSPLPTYVIYSGVTYNYLGGSGTIASPAEYRDPAASGACSSYSGFNSTITLPDGTICSYLGSALPLTWLSLNCGLNNSIHAIITFKVNETNVVGYEIEKSNDGITFSKIGFINSQGIGVHNYQFTEPNVLDGVNLYRIKQIDVEGSYSYSSTIRLSNGKYEGYGYKIYPNPTMDMVKVSGAEVGTKAFLTEANGKLLQQINVKDKTFTIDMSEYSGGLYFLKTNDGAVQKIIKE